MTTARMDYFVCRASATAPEGVVFYAGAYRLSSAEVKGGPVKAVVANTALLRKDAYVGDRTSSEMVADLLNRLGPCAGMQGQPQWQAVPVALHMPTAAKPECVAAAANEVL